MAESIIKTGGVGSKITRFFQETRAEVKKVVWPDKKYVANATVVVLIIVILVALFIMFIDSGFSNAFKALRGLI